MQILSLFKNIKPVVAIDGTAASGKGTIAKVLAKKLKFDHLDTGILYRYIAFLKLKENINLNTFSVEKYNISLRDLYKLDLRSEEVSKNSSIVSKNKNIRKELLKFQRNFANFPSSQNGSVIDGRDIASVVIPMAEVKIFVDADVKIRAKRRYQELKLSGKMGKENDVLIEMKQRDNRDINRTFSPLTKHPDAFLIDTTLLSKDESLKLALDIIKNIL